MAEWKKTVEQRIIDEYLDYVKDLLRSSGRKHLLAPPPTGFGIGSIKKAVRLMIERVDDPQELDWKTIWSRLDKKDYDHVEDFMADLPQELLPPPPPEDRWEVEEPPKDVHELLKGLDLEMPSPDDPYFVPKLEELLRTLATDLEEAEQTSERVLLRGPDGKNHWYSAKGVEKLFGKVHERYRQEKETLQEKIEKEKELRKAAEKESLIRFKVLQTFQDGMIRFVVGHEHSVEPEREEWVNDKVQRGLIQLIGPLRKKLSARVKLEVEKTAIGKYWFNIKYQGMLICGSGCETFSRLLERLEKGEDHIDLYFQALRQLGDEETAMKELEDYPAPFNSKEIVRAHWTMEDVKWDEPSREDYRIYRTTYPEGELQRTNVERLKRIARVKLGKTYPTKREMINAILGKRVEPEVTVVYEKPSVKPTQGLVIPKELKEEADKLWSEYRSAVITGDTARSEKTLNRLSEIRTLLSGLK